MRDLYITNNGKLNRKDDSLLFTNKTTKKIVPIKDIDNIYVFSEITINTKLLTFLSKLNIEMYFYNYYGFYSGAFTPRKKEVSGKLLVEQVKNYLDKESRLSISKEFLYGSIHNMRKTLMQYKLNEEAEKIKAYEKNVKDVKNIQNLMLKEAEIKEFYYKQINKIIRNKDFFFVKRVRNPPDNFINTLISFGNSLLYTTILSELFKTQLNPTISYLHEPFERRYSLNLDIADIFKPLVVDRVIFSLINRQQIKPEHFNKELNFCYLSKEGRYIFLREYDNKLRTTIKYPGLNRKVSYKYMFRLEGYKLIKFLLENKKYKAFKIYW